MADPVSLPHQKDPRTGRDHHDDAGGRGDAECCGPVLATLTPYSFFPRHHADPCPRAAGSGEKGSMTSVCMARSAEVYISGFFVFEGVVGAGASFPVWGSGLAGPLRTARNSALFPVWESGSPGGGGSDAVHPRGLDMPDVTFARPDPTALRRLDGPGPEVAGRRLGPDRAVLARRVVGPGRWCRRCGCEGVERDSTKNPETHSRTRGQDAAGRPCTHMPTRSGFWIAPTMKS